MLPRSKPMEGWVARVPAGSPCEKLKSRTPTLNRLGGIRREGVANAPSLRHERTIAEFLPELTVLAGFAVVFSGARLVAVVDHGAVVTYQLGERIQAPGMRREMGHRQHRTAEEIERHHAPPNGASPSEAKMPNDPAC